MIAATVWNQLVSTLENNPALSDYIKMVFEGRRYNIEPESLPCIMLEPVRNNETETDFNQVKDILLSVDIFAFSSNNPHEFKRTIVGGQDYKGILDIENDIRACLASSYTLGDNVIDIRCEPTVFDALDIGKYPVRGLLIPIKILYRQTDGV
jgi:hypothetical protein